jgi:hypothetical protein
LVNAGEEDVAAATEDLGGAVAVVNIPVEDEDPLDAELGDRQRDGTATLSKRQKPIARAGSAWWPGGRPAAKPTLASPASSARAIAQAAPAERSAAS